MPWLPWTLVALPLVAAPGRALPQDAGAGETPAGAGATDAGPGMDAGAGSFKVFFGKVTEVDWAAHRLTVEAADGPLVMGFDRNTAVYLPGHLGTMRDVRPGVEVRTSQGPDQMAHWIEIRRPPATPAGGSRDAGAPDAGSVAAPAAATPRGAGHSPAAPGAAADGGPAAPADGGSSPSAPVQGEKR